MLNEILMKSVILRIEIGSTAYGTGDPGKEDYDEIAIAIEPKTCIYGLDKVDTYTYRPGRGPEDPSGPGDYDLVVYPLKKWFNLALNANPSVLMALWSKPGIYPSGLPTMTPLGEDLRANKGRFISNRIFDTHIGYAQGQIKRMKRGKFYKSRQKIVEEYGYDCYLSDTEFLTPSGWKNYDDIKEDEPVGTFNPNTSCFEFQTPFDRVKKEYSGEIYYLESQKSSLAVTPNHRMWVSPANRSPTLGRGTGYYPEKADWDFRSFADLKSSGRDWYHSYFTAENNNLEYDIEDEYLTLLGYYVSEGCVDKWSSVSNLPRSIRIEQKEIEDTFFFDNMARVSRVFPSRHYCYEKKNRTGKFNLWTFSGPIVQRLASDGGIGSENKRLPSWIFDLSTRQAKVLLEALIEGDGTVHKSGGWVYYTISKTLADDIQALCVSNGLRSSIWGPYWGPYKIKQSQNSGMYQIRITEDDPIFAFSLRQNLKIKHVESTEVVCFSVPNETLVTRRNGKPAIQGNTKFAMHALRLVLQAQEIVETGSVEIPIPNPRGDLLRLVRKGGLSQDDFYALFDKSLDELKVLQKNSQLPDEPDRQWANEWLEKVYRDYYAER